MEDILDLARQLGKKVAASERFQALKAARARLVEDEDARQLQEEYDKAALLLHDKIAKGQPLEPDEKRNELKLREKVAANETLATLIRAQADLHQLMHSVNAEIEEQTK